MSAIDKMFEKYGVKPEKRFKECKENAKNIGLCSKYPCINCENSVFIDKYPPFTAEKQLELETYFFKIIPQLCLSFENRSNNFDYYIDAISYIGAERQDALINLALSKWKLLTSAQRQEVKEILER